MEDQNFGASLKTKHGFNTEYFFTPAKSKLAISGLQFLKKTEK